MNNYKKAKIKILKDYSKFKEIHELAYGKFFTSNKINNPNLFPGFDISKNTKTIVAEIDNKIVGTNSITIDGNIGLPSDKYFKNETDFIRNQTNGNVGNSWKIAISENNRANIGILFDLIQKTVELASEMEIVTCLYIFPKKHENIYRKLIKAETIAEKKCNIGDVKDVNLVLMQTNTKDTIKHLNELFTNRKF